MEIVKILKSDLLLPGLTNEGAIVDESGVGLSGAGELKIDHNFTKGSYTLEMEGFETNAHHLYIKEGDRVVLEVSGDDKGQVVVPFELVGETSIRIGTEDKDGNPTMELATMDHLRIYRGDINAAEVRLRPSKLMETKKVDLEGWYLEGEFPLEAADHVQQDYIILANTKSKGEQPFRINNVQKKKRTVEFEANHIVFDMRRYTIDTLPMEDVGVANALTRIKEATDRPNPFIFNSTLVSTKSHVFEPQTMLEAIGFLIERWGGRLDINGLKMTLREEMGEDRGETISYGKNLEDIRVWENWDGVITKLFVIGPDGAKLPETYVLSETQYDNVYSGVVEFQYSDRISEDDTEEAKLDDLRQQAIRYLDKSQFPKIAMQVTSNINQDLELWDHVVVKHPALSKNLPNDVELSQSDLDELGVPIRVLSYTYDILAGRVTKLEYGDYSVGIKSFIKGPLEELEKEVEGKFIDHEKNLKDQTNLINNLNKNGHVVIEDDIIYVVDTLPKEDAKNVIQIGLGGIGFSNTGIDGTFNTAWDIEGNFNADFISAGTIEGSLIKTESIQAEHLSIDAKQVLMNFAKGGGTNLIRNSVGYAGIRYPWIFPELKDRPQDEGEIVSWMNGRGLVDGKIVDKVNCHTDSKYRNPEFLLQPNTISLAPDKGWTVTVATYGSDFIYKRTKVFNHADTMYLNDDEKKYRISLERDPDKVPFPDIHFSPPYRWLQGKVTTAQTTWALSHISKHSLLFTDGGGIPLKQDVVLPRGRMYTLSATINKKTITGEFELRFEDKTRGEVYSQLVSKDEEGEKFLRVEIPHHDDTIEGTVVLDAKASVTALEHTEVTDLMLAEGNATQWQQAAGESYTTDVLFDADGVRVIRRDPETGQPVGETVMTPYEFAGYFNDEKVFTLNGDLTEVKGLTIKELGLYISPVKMVQNQAGAGSLDIVWTGKGE